MDFQKKYELLEKQLGLLSEQSEKCATLTELVALSHAMAAIAGEMRRDY